MSGQEYLTYGGSTTSLAIVNGSTVMAFIDAGSGLISFHNHGLDLPKSLPIFLTHYHWDHIQGISMLGEVWAGACSLAFYGPGDPEPMLREAIRPPWFPVSLDDAPEPILFGSVGEPTTLGPVTVTAFEVQHPQGAVGYRIDGPSRSLAVVTDHESAPECDDLIVAANQGVDVLMHDAQYLPDEAASHEGWGHSTWEDAVAMARRLGVAELLLTSHDPTRADDEIEAMLVEARRGFENTVAVSPGLRIPL